MHLSSEPGEHVPAPPSSCVRLTLDSRLSRSSFHSKIHNSFLLLPYRTLILINHTFNCRQLVAFEPTRINAPPTSDRGISISHYSVVISVIKAQGSGFFHDGSRSQNSYVCKTRRINIPGFQILTSDQINPWAAITLAI